MNYFIHDMDRKVCFEKFVLGHVSVHHRLRVAHESGRDAVRPDPRARLWNAILVEKGRSDAFFTGI